MRVFVPDGAGYREANAEYHDNNEDEDGSRGEI
jgi:hypothetical protein